MSDINATTYQKTIVVTKSNTVADPQNPITGLFIAVTGNVRFRDQYGNLSAITGAPAGLVIPIPTLNVTVAATTATAVGLVAPPFKKAVSA